MYELWGDSELSIPCRPILRFVYAFRTDLVFCIYCEPIPRCLSLRTDSALRFRMVYASEFVQRCGPIQRGLFYACKSILHFSLARSRPVAPSAWVYFFCLLAAKGVSCHEPVHP